MGRCRSCARPPTLVPCAKCGTPFWPLAGGASHARAYCVSCRARVKRGMGRISGEERRLRRLARAAARRESLMRARRANPRHCLWCHAEFVPENSQKSYCCREHQNRAKSVRRKARLRGAGGDPLSIGELYERDGGVCHLCGGIVDRDLRWPAGGSASIDHVLPLSLGGRDAPDNLKLAHLVCNLRKSDMGAQRPRGAVVVHLDSVRKTDNRACSQCGVPIPSTSARWVYCSDRCARRAHPRNRGMSRRTCTRCGVVFKTRNGKKKTCGIGVTCEGTAVRFSAASGHAAKAGASALYLPSQFLGTQEIAI